MLTTRSMSCLTLCSRPGVPMWPRKYLLTTTFVASWLHDGRHLDVLLLEDRAAALVLDLRRAQLPGRSRRRGGRPGCVQRRSKLRPRAPRPVKLAGSRGSVRVRAGAVAVRAIVSRPPAPSASLSCGPLAVVRAGPPRRRRARSPSPAPTRDGGPGVDRRAVGRVARRPSNLVLGRPLSSRFGGENTISGISPPFVPQAVVSARRGSALTRPGLGDGRWTACGDRVDGGRKPVAAGP